MNGNVRWPVAVSSSGRYFVDGDGEPFFWLADTQWELFRAFSLDDVNVILTKRKQQGFTTIQVMLTGVGDGTKANPFGKTPWTQNGPSVPDEAYFEHVDAVVRLAEELGLVLVVGVFHQLQASLITEENARTWARWIAERYRDTPNLIWSMYPKAEEQCVPVVRELATGLQEGHGGTHVITVHPDPAVASSSFIHDEPWLDFNSSQTWAHTDQVIPIVTHDRDLTPTKPAVMAEGAYEAGSEYGFDVTPLWVRRQAYWTYLAGGHHSYGHNDCWRVLPTWREALNAPGAAQLGILREVLEGQSGWWDLVPGQSMLTECEEGDPALNVAARSAAGDWCLAYLGGEATVSVRMDAIADGGTVEVSWIDPRGGERTEAGSFARSDVQAFATPEGWEDALLLLERRG